ncbi:MAG: glycine oxidase ThiO [Gammaproteobacteria bacterium HGW-Gammaproteobacteria-14]|nr:MAG: glycine oxidase ThiO [Gammaproteobacteria bacterium HGW-Gammaproteobacteria-14]
MQFDTLVIGAGVAGLMSALELRDRGQRVLVIGSPHAPPASWAGGGILSPLFPWRYPDALLPLTSGAFSAYEHWAHRIAEVGGISPELAAGGMRVWDDVGADELAVWSQRSGMVAQWDMTPYGGMASPSIWMPDVGRIRNPRLLKGLRHLVKATLDIVLVDAHVQSFHSDERGVFARTEHEDFRADRALIAAGAWSDRFLPDDGKPYVFPVKGQMLMYRVPEGGLTSVLLTPNGYLIPRSSGLVLVGSTVEPGLSDSLPTHEAMDRLKTVASQLLPPSTRGAELVAQWAGVRPGSRRPVPWIGSVPEYGGRVWLNSGHFRNGLVCAPASARLVAQLMTGVAPFCNPEPYAPLLSSSSSSP